MKRRYLAAAISCLLICLAAPGANAQWAEHGVPVVAQPNSQSYNCMVSDWNDGAYVAWEDYRNNAHYEVYLQRLGPFGDPLWAVDGVDVTGMLAVDQRAPAITHDAAGGVIVAYQDNHMLNFNIKAQRVNPDGTIQWAVTGAVVCSASNDQLYPVIAPDWYGGAYVAWIDERDAGNGRDLFMQRIDADGVPQWAANGIPVCTAPGNQEYPEMIEDGTGGVIITWHDKRNDFDGDIFAQRVNSSGVVQWAIDGAGICVELASSQSSPKIARDGFGGAVIAWSDSRGPKSNIYAQRINSAGSVQWTANGIAVTYTDYVQHQPDIAYDPWNYGVIIAWSHGTASGSNLFAQRLNSAGTPQWSGNGAYICSQEGNQTYPRVIPDYFGGSYIAWIDERNYQQDIFIQHIDGDGINYWISGGIPVAVRPGSQGSIDLVTTNDYSPILSWLDQRILDSGNDVFAQRIDRHGYWGNPAPRITGVDDVPNDAGGRLLLSWDRSRVDAFPEEVVTRYEVLRSPVMDYAWETVASIDAYQLERYAYTDTTPADDYTYYYQVIAHTADPLVDWQSMVATGSSAVDLAPAPPQATRLAQNYPNPFNPTTRIAFELRRDGRVQLEIFDAAGRLVRQLVDEKRGAGVYDETWDGLSGAGDRVASGVYFYRLRTGAFEETRKMVLLR
ncbi:MAG: T9SS type A sorting domain-containing protein [Candidatus Krumholzibacteriota bacterium]|nr:T9SS type A sorting domain-containing protein [Candidatus Krumholzibacteriota bacterium]